MRRLIPAMALTLGALLLTACGPDMGWSKKGVSPSSWTIDEENCVWEQTHELLPDGTYKLVEPSDEEVEAGVKACMQAKGYSWGPVED